MAQRRVSHPRQTQPSKPRPLKPLTRKSALVSALRFPWPSQKRRRDRAILPAPSARIASAALLVPSADTLAAYWSRSRPLRTLSGAQQRRYSFGRLATSSPAGPPGARGRTGVTRAGVSGRVAELACVSVADQGLKRDVVARPGRRQCQVSVLGTADRRQAGRDERLERHHVRLAPGAFGEPDGLARAPALWAWESRTGPGAQTQIDTSAFEVDIAAHHAPRRLKLQRKLEELLHAPDRDAVGHRPGMVSARPRRARSRTIRTCAHYRTRDMTHSVAVPGSRRAA